MCQPVCLPWSLILSGSQDKLELRSRRRPRSGSLFHTRRCRFPRIPRRCSSCGAPLTGVSSLDFSELFLQPRAQLQLSTSTHVPFLVGFRDVLDVPSLARFNGAWRPQLGLRPRCFPRSVSTQLPASVPHVNFTSVASRTCPRALS